MNHTGDQRGFGLLEVVLSAGILATVVGASVGLLNSSLRRATIATDRATAMNLAQEGIELVRAARDTSYIDGLSNTWTASLGLDPPSSGEGTIELPGTDSYALVYQQFSDTTCCFWKLGKTGAGISNGVETITLGDQMFQREIYVTLPEINYQQLSGLGALASGIQESDVIRKVKVIVRWGVAKGEAVESITYLTDWRQGV